MSAFFGQIFSLLSAPQGNLVYQLVLVFSIAGAMQSAFTHWRSSEFPQARRTMLGLAVLLGAQILLFLLSSLDWQSAGGSEVILPPLDRAFALISIIWVTWLWAFPEPSAPAEAGAGILSLLAVTGAALNILVWAPQSATTAYNQSIYDFFWQAASMGLILLGGLVLIVRQPNGFGNGLAFLSLAFLGHAGHLVVPEQGNYSGILHLAYLAAYPLLLTLPQRFPSAIASTQAITAESERPGPEQKRYSAEPKTFHALMSLAAESSAPKVSRAITRAISQTMLSDLCFLVYLTDNKNQLVIASGYDLIREENLEGGALNKTAIPMLTNAIQRGRPLRLPASGTSADIKGLAGMLGLNTPGNMLSVPIVTPERESLGGIILLSPYSNRLWSAEDQAFLANIASSLVPIIQRSQKTTRLEQEDELNRQALEAARGKIEELEEGNQELSRQIESFSDQSARESAQLEELEALRSAQDQAGRTIDELQAQLEMQQSSGRLSGTKLEQELNGALRDVARLQNQLVESSQKLLEVEKTGGDRRKKEQVEVIASISQELRQPMSSIVGYTDLLLGESVGILGALQRKFIERIKAATERIGSLIEDMIQLNTLEVGLGELKPEAMDLNLIIDNALAYTSSQVREKNISMHLDLPKRVAPVNADREALQQILIHLLQNAGAATPVEGTIGLKVQTTRDDGQAFVMIQVTDSGGGIPEEDMPRVFTRLYRADNVLIQGVGDTGVGLSIAKTLTEAQRGRIWVESEQGVGATFNVLLPIVGEPIEDRARKEIS